MNLVLIDDTTEPIQDIRYVQEQLGYDSVNQFDHLKGLPFYNRTPRIVTIIRNVLLSKSTKT